MTRVLRLSILLVCLSLNSVFGQFLADDDPLNRPLGWQELQSNPNDKASWEAYMGKKWEAFSYKEAIQVKILRQRLWRKQKEDQKRQETAFAGRKNATEAKRDDQKEEQENTKVEEEPRDEDTGSSDNVDRSTEATITTMPSAEETTLPFTEQERYRQVLRKAKVKRYMNQLDEVFLAQSSEMDELLKDAFTNFFIIEDYYREAFAEYGVEYVSYEEKYPRGGYSEMRWIRDQQERLKEVRKNALRKLKQSFLEEQLRQENR